MHTDKDLLIFALDLIIKLLQNHLINTKMITGKSFIKIFHLGIKFKIKRISNLIYSLLSLVLQTKI